MRAISAREKKHSEKDGIYIDGRKQLSHVFVLK